MNVNKSEIHNMSKGLLLPGILSLLIGIIAIAFPMETDKLTIVMIGVFLIAVGLTRGIFSIFTFSVGTIILQYIISLLMIVTGIWLTANTNTGLELISIVLAVYFIVDGAISIAYLISLQHSGGRVHLLVNGLIGMLLGILIWIQWPSTGTYVLGIFVGIKLIFDGIAFILTATVARKQQKL